MQDDKRPIKHMRASISSPRMLGIVGEFGLSQPTYSTALHGLRVAVSI